MPSKRVMPPNGYSLQSVPNFLRPTAASMAVQIQPPNGVDISRVTSDNPNVIQVNQPDQFGQPQLNHEVTHGYQFSRNPAVVDAMQAVPIARDPINPMAAYGYGGADGLLAAQQQHKSITDFNMEQQAQMVSNYRQQAQHAIATKNVAMLDKLNRAYGLYMDQLARLPGRNDSMTQMSPQDLTPAAPGLPPSAITGIMEPLPAIGGNARLVRR